MLQDNCGWRADSPTFCDHIVKESYIRPVAQTDPFDEAVKSENVSTEVVASVTNALNRFRAEHDLDPADWQIRIFPGSESQKIKLLIGGPSLPTIRTGYEIDSDGDIEGQTLSKLEIHRNSKRLGGMT